MFCLVQFIITAVLQRYISQGSVAMHLRFDGIFNDHITANLLPSLPTKDCENCSVYGKVRGKSRDGFVFLWVTV